MSSFDRLVLRDETMKLRGGFPSSSGAGQPWTCTCSRFAHRWSSSRYADLLHGVLAIRRASTVHASSPASSPRLWSSVPPMRPVSLAVVAVGGCGTRLPAIGARASQGAAAEALGRGGVRLAGGGGARSTGRGEPLLRSAEALAAPPAPSVTADGQVRADRLDKLLQKHRRCLDRVGRRIVARKRFASSARQARRDIVMAASADRRPPRPAALGPDEDVQRYVFFRGVAAAHARIPATKTIDAKGWSA